MTTDQHVVQQSSNDVSPWPQADRAIPTQGELAEDRFQRGKHRFESNVKRASSMLAKTCGIDDAVFSSGEKRHDPQAVPVPSTALGYALGQFGQLQIQAFSLRRAGGSQ